eukprot:gene14045-17076_t
MGVHLSAFQAGVIGMGIAYSAYQAENFRTGIIAVEQGQREAAEALGMRSVLMMRRVILPQAFRIALPPYGNTLVMMLKDSSLVSTITVAEMTRQGQLIASSTFQNMTVYTLVALLYLLMSLPLVYGLRRMEQHLGRRKKHYGTHRVLHGVDLDVAKGEVVSYDGGTMNVFGETVQRGSKTVHALRSRRTAATGPGRSLGAAG